MRKRSLTVSFRLDVDLHKRLCDQGSSNNLSAGETARSFVVAQLLGGEAIAERDHFASVEKMLIDLGSSQKAIQKRLAYLLFAVLKEVGKLSSEDAKEIVRRDLLKREDA